MSATDSNTRCDTESSIHGNLDKFDFRGLHPRVFIGTASDRYAGWIGQIYTSENYEGRVTSRSHTVGGKSFTEKVLPVASVSEYFQHFRALELDFTFYDTILNAEGKPTNTHRALNAYAGHMPEAGRLLLKVPQKIFARKVWNKQEYVDNENYLNAVLFKQRFYEPALALLSPWLSGFVFEQEYQRSAGRTSIGQFARDLDRFFSSIPRDGGYHLEIRTSAFLEEPVFEVMKAHGIGQVFSHWTWLPPLSGQFKKIGCKFLNEKKDCLIRLMTPRGMRYEQAYRKAHPFDSLIPGMLDPRMVEDTARIMKKAVSERANAYVIVNNRSGGNAPLTAQQIARLFIGGQL
jgi:uncharacterized protein YecE (DUF72 family)